MHDLRFTQNFLHNKQLVEQIVSLAALNLGDTVLEIGPGKGIITSALAERVTVEGRVLAVELDERLIPDLNHRFERVPQVSVIHADILNFDIRQHAQKFSVFSNVPFNITSEVLDLLFTQDYAPSHACLILQRDALISASEYGVGETLKSLLIKPRYQINVIHEFSRADFTPRPSVDTALFRFDRLPSPLIAAEHYLSYRDFLAFVSKDRVGEGVWRKVFSKHQLKLLTQSTGLISGRGLRSQSANSIVAAFRIFMQNPSKLPMIQGGMAGLRQEQRRRETLNKAGGHHRSKKRNR